MSAGAIRLALVGAGRWGRNYIRTIAALDDVRLVAVASRNPETVALVPAGCVIVEDWRAIVDAPDVDGVIIASPPASHAEILIASVEHGKAVLVEKPVVMLRSDATLIRSALARRDTTILVGHTHLFHPAFRTLCREASVLGSIRSITSSAGNRGPYRRDASVIWDWAPHDLAMCLKLVPGPARVVRAARLEAESIHGVDAERLALELALSGSIPARITVSSMDERHRWFAAEFESCTLVFRDFVESNLARYAHGHDIHSNSGTAIATDDERPLTRAVMEFAANIRTMCRDRGSIDLGLAIVDLIADAESMLGQA